MFLSVIICTRDRADEAAKCLRRLVEQAVVCDDVEVIVVDNGSSDNTKETVDAIAGEAQYSVRYVYEPVGGLCQARNRGRVAEARGGVLVYIDDDVSVGDSWVEQIRQHFTERKSDCLGGKVTAELEAELPFPMDDSLLWFFQATALGEEVKELKFPAHPIGCNMAFTTEVFDAVGGFDTALKLYGDETDFFRRVAERGFRTLYDPSISVNQIIPAERLTKEAIQEKSYSWGRGGHTFFDRKAKEVSDFGGVCQEIDVDPFFVHAAKE